MYPSTAQRTRRIARPVSRIAMLARHHSIGPVPTVPIQQGMPVPRLGPATPSVELNEYIMDAITPIPCPLDRPVSNHIGGNGVILNPLALPELQSPFTPETYFATNFATAEEHLFHLKRQQIYHDPHQDIFTVNAQGPHARIRTIESAWIAGELVSGLESRFWFACAERQQSPSVFAARDEYLRTETLVQLAGEYLLDARPKEKIIDAIVAAGQTVCASTHLYDLLSMIQSYAVWSGAQQQYQDYLDQLQES